MSLMIIKKLLFFKVEHNIAIYSDLHICDHEGWHTLRVYIYVSGKVGPLNGHLYDRIRKVSTMHMSCQILKVSVNLQLLIHFRY